MSGKRKKILRKELIGILGRTPNKTVFDVNGNVSSPNEFRKFKKEK